MATEPVNLILSGTRVPEHSGASIDDGVVLLGIPSGGVEFIKDRLAELIASAKEYCSKLGELQDAQAALTLLRLCGGACRLVHFMRAVSPVLIASQLAEFDELIMETFTQCTGVHLDANSSMQVGLPVSMGGCGLTKAQDIAGAAWLAAQLAFHSRGAALLMVPNAMLGKVPIDLGEICRGVIQLCPAVQPAVAYILAPDSSALPELASDKLHWWSQHIHQHLHRQLIEASTARDRARLSCINDSHASAWLSACPSESVGL